MYEERVEVLRRELEKGIMLLPAGFHDTFNFTRTGMNLCHPVTLGLLAKVVGEMDGIGYVGVDVRLNEGKGLKFQPDIVGYLDADGLQNNQAVIFVDFESPNSCDTRITQYHLDQYLAWVKNPKHRAPYVIVTSLPDAEALTWELRYTSDLNREHKGNLKKIRDNPFQYWTRAWAEAKEAKALRSRPGFSDVFFLNISNRDVTEFPLLSRTSPLSVWRHHQESCWLGGLVGPKKEKPGHAGFTNRNSIRDPKPLASNRGHPGAKSRALRRLDCNATA